MFPGRPPRARSCSSALWADSLQRFYPSSCCSPRVKARSGGAFAKGNTGFTLIELLVVVALIAVLSFLAAPAFQSIGRARGVTQAADIMVTAVELARTEAVNRRTYVWLAVRQETNNGRNDLQVAVVGSRDGTTKGGDNLLPLVRPQTMERIALVDSETAGTAAELSGVNAGLVFQSGPYAFGDGRTLTFFPTGEVTTAAAPGAAEGFMPLLAIGLAPLKGDQPDTDPNARAAVLIDGSTGSAKLIRP
jgi:prepilin-type N-terminal cleavage/methylation domain-containing protein